MRKSEKNDVKIKPIVPWGVPFSIAMVLNLIAIVSNDSFAYVVFGLPAAIFYIYFVKSLLIEVHVEALEVFNGQERAVK